MRNQRRAGGLWMRLALGAGLAVGLALFLDRYAAQVAPYYPRYFDQLSGYFTLYRVHYALLDPELALSAKLALVNATLIDLRGWAVPLIATALGFAFGPNRLAFASTNYIFFAAIVAALAGAMARRFDPWTAAAAVGFLLASRSVYLVTGGLDDLRMDFAGLAMFGIFVLALLRMAEAPGRAGIALVALAYAASLWSRSITGVYGLGAIAVFGLISLAIYGVGGDRTWLRRWWAAFGAGLLAALLFAIYVALQYRAIDSYYFNLLRTDEARIRLAEFSLASRADLLPFFLRQAAWHFRLMANWFAVALALTAAALVGLWLGGVRPARAATGPLGAALAVTGAAAIGVLAPLAFFAPSPVVIGVLTVPLAALAATILAVAKSAVPSRHLANAIALVPLASGLWVAGTNLAVPTVWPPREIAMAQAHNELFERVAEDRGGTIAWMTVTEGANWAGLSVRLYETGRAAAVGQFHHTAIALFALDASAILEQIAAADGVVIWHRFPAHDPYPSVASLRRTQGEWQPILDRAFALRYEMAMPEGSIAYYRRLPAPPAPGGSG